MALSGYTISEVPLEGGTLGIAPIPGRGGALAADVNAILRWGADMVLTMTTMDELRYVGSETLGEDLRAAGVAWRHLPVPDFGAPPDDTMALWPEASATAHRLLGDGGKVMAHCFGGCGRAGMALMRLMVEAGEDADPALARLRDARPCAVERDSQRAWAAIPMFQRNGWSP